MSNIEYKIGTLMSLTLDKDIKLKDKNSYKATRLINAINCILFSASVNDVNDDFHKNAYKLLFDADIQCGWSFDKRYDVINNLQNAKFEIDGDKASCFYENELIDVGTIDNEEIKKNYLEYNNLKDVVIDYFKQFNDDDLLKSLAYWVDICHT